MSELRNATEQALIDFKSLSDQTWGGIHQTIWTSEGYNHLPLFSQVTKYSVRSSGNSNSVEFGKHKFSSYFKSKDFNTVKSNNVFMSFSGAQQSRASVVHGNVENIFDIQAYGAFKDSHDSHSKD